MSEANTLDLTFVALSVFLMIAANIMGRRDEP